MSSEVQRNAPGRVVTAGGKQSIMAPFFSALAHVPGVTVTGGHASYDQGPVVTPYYAPRFERDNKGRQAAAKEKRDRRRAKALRDAQRQQEAELSKAERIRQGRALRNAQRQQEGRP